MMNLANYRIIETIHDSYHSTVHRALRDEDNFPVILKLPQAECPTALELTYYRHEFEILSQLHLPGVIGVHALQPYQNTILLVLEDFGGSSLSQLQNNHKLSVIELLPLFIQIADHLGQLHAADLIHKDINPNNIICNLTSGQIKLIDFGIASRLPRENPTLKSPNQLEGTLAYLSPEQTGRMNRSLDYRTDLYSLGISFYELLGGQLPFISSDPLEVVHGHLAKQPAPLTQLNPQVPHILSDVVMKLIAKNAEDRYQSALGLKHDLEVIRTQWIHLTIEVPRFELAQHDSTGKFQLPQQLYGREAEISQLWQAFERITQGTAELLLIAGYSGIGKTALVQELYKPMTAKRGYFIAGKFDQFQRNVPYIAVVQAFRDLIDQLLTEAETQLELWKSQILLAVGGNGQVLLEMIPELELLLGKQPEIPSLLPTESQNRFNLVFQNFVKVFCQAEHPLVIFFDDLQWIDSASLQLMRLMMSDIPYLLLIGAYRDNEVGAGHPLLNSIAEMQKQGIATTTLTLMPLDLPELNQLISDTLHLNSAQTLPLTELVLHKTGGNPFFVGEFLKTLYSDQLLSFNRKARCWQWKLEHIQAHNITDNVVVLMTDKIQRLNPNTQRMLTLAAALGNRFDAATLANVCEHSEAEIKDLLWEALMIGLILPKDGEYRFVHDRVQQAAYLLIPQEECPTLHWNIGQLLLTQDASSVEEHLFKIVDHLNLGIHLANSTQRQELAYLNLHAGRKAREASAYQAAYSYLTIGLSLLDAHCWQHHYQLALTLYQETALSSYLIGHFAEATALAETVIAQVQTILDAVPMYELLMDIEAAQLHTLQALQIGVKIVNLLGIPLASTPPTFLDISDIETLLELPAMTNPYARAALPILSKCVPAAYQSDLNLLLQVVYTMVHLSVQHGNDANSAFGYAMYGLVLSNSADSVETGYRFGKLGLQVLEKYYTPALECRVKHIFNSHIRFIKDALRDTLEPMQMAAQAGLATGDFEFTTYISNIRGVHLIFSGYPLAEVAQEYEQLWHLMRAIRIEHGTHLSLIFRQLVITLMGKSTENCRLIGAEFDEMTMTPIFIAANQLNLLGFLYFAKLFLCFLMEEQHTALSLATDLFDKGYIQGITSQNLYVQSHFYQSLILLANTPVTPNATPETTPFLARVLSNQQQLQQWARHCPENYQAMYALVEAELARVQGQLCAAIEYYEQAIHAAQDSQVLPLEALSYELAAKCYLARHLADFAQTYLIKSYQRYQLWGAEAKLRLLEKRYPQWLPPQRASTTPLTSLTFSSQTERIVSPSNWLDLTSFLKAAQALSGEIRLENLLTKMMLTVIENAGAQRGVLILEQQGQWYIQAEVTVQPETVTVLQQLPLDDQDQVPMTLLNYAIRTKQSLVFSELSRESNYRDDPYVKTHLPKSALCLLLQHQQKLAGIIYLENNLIAGAFTPDRFQVLTLLSSQMAISLDNARFFRELEHARQTAEAANQAKTAFLANVTHELRTPLNGILGYTQLLQLDNLTPDQQEAVTVIHQSGEHLLLLVSDILDFSKLQMSQLELQLSEMYLGQLLSELVHWFQQQTREKGLGFYFEADPQLPIGIVADVKRLRQILQHLLSNAVKFTSQGNIRFQVQSAPIPERQGWQRLRFTVADTGIGMNVELLEKVFHPFEQANDWLNKTAGVGLGLCLVKQLVELMDGQIEVNSQIGQGSQFIVTLDFAESLAWQQDTRHTESSTISTDEVLKGPPREYAAQLYEFAKVGDFFEIIEFVNLLEQEDASLRPFAAKIRQWAKDFREAPIEELIQRFL